MKRRELSNQKIRDLARECLLHVYNLRDDLIRRGAKFEEVLAKGAELIALVNAFKIVRMQELPTESIQGRAFAQSETAGILDRQNKRILIARRFPLRTQRFTLAHEIGHLVLHPMLVQHRDIPLIGNARTNVSRTETEADVFASELLMPRKYVKRVFTTMFGDAIAPEALDQNVAYQLSIGTNSQVSVSMLIQMSPFERALLFVKCISWRGRTFRSLVDHFDVSSAAMARQLCDQKLIS